MAMVLALAALSLAAAATLLLGRGGEGEPLVPEEPRTKVPGRLRAAAVGDDEQGGFIAQCEFDAQVIVRDGVVTRVREQGDRPPVKVGDRVVNPPTQSWVGLDADVREVDFDLHVYWGSDGLLHVGCAPESVIYRDGREIQVTDAPTPRPEEADAETLRDMVESFQIIVVGKVIEVTGSFQHDFQYDAPGQAPVTIPYASASIQPLRWLWPKDMPTEKSLTVVFPFGLERGEEMVPGATYLLFLADSTPYGGAGLVNTFARFRILDDGRVVPNAFVSYSGIKAVTGVTLEEMFAAKSAPDPQAALMALGRLTIDEVAAKIEAAIARGPLPIWTPRPKP